MKRVISQVQPTDALEAVTVFNKPVCQSYEVLQRLMVRQMHGAASLFAEPNEDRQRLCWSTELPGAVCAWTSLPRARRAALEPERARVANALAALLADLAADGLNTPRGNLAQLLRAALIIPSLDHLCVVGDALVLTCWGFRRAGQAGVDVLGGAAPPPATVQAWPRPPADAPPIARPATGGRRRWLILPPLLLLATSLIWLLLAQSERRPTVPPGPYLFGSTTWLPDALRGNIYFLPAGIAALPDFDPLTPVGTIYARALNVPARSFTDGFPGVTNRFEWFGIRYAGTITVPAAATYSFRVVSDDGARLYIDNRLLIDDDGIHAATSRGGQAMLAAGPHGLRLDYFQGPRTQLALQLFCAGPDGIEHLFPGCGLALSTERPATWRLHVSVRFLWQVIRGWWQ